MTTIYLLEDNDAYREDLIEALAEQKPDAVIYDNDNDIDYPRKIISDFRGHNDPSRTFAILDLELKTITWGPWCKKNADNHEKKNADVGSVEIESPSVHGWNIYRIIRDLSEEIKIALLSTHTKEQMLKHLGYKNIPKDNNLIFIHRGPSGSDVAKILAFFFHKLK